MEKILESEKKGTRMINIEEKELLLESYETKKLDITKQLEHQIVDVMGSEKLAEINQLINAFREVLLRMLLLNPSIRESLIQTLSRLDTIIYDLSQSEDPAIVLGFDETLQRMISELQGYMVHYVQPEKNTQDLKS